jgi:hypothetical protein
MPISIVSLRALVAAGATAEMVVAFEPHRQRPRFHRLVHDHTHSQRGLSQIVLPRKASKKLTRYTRV